MDVATTSLMNFNCDDLNDLSTFLADHGVQAWQLQLVNVMGNMAECNDYVVAGNRCVLLVMCAEVDADLPIIFRQNHSNRTHFVAGNG